MSIKEAPYFRTIGSMVKEESRQNVAPGLAKEREELAVIID